MRRAYRHGLRTALSQWRLVLLVFFLSLLGGLTFMGCSWLWLADVLDASLATRTLATQLDVEVFVDILAHHRGSLRVFAGVAALLLAGGFLLWIWINATIVSAVTPVGAADDVPHPAARYRSFLLLWVLAALCNAVALAGLYALWTVVDGWSVQRADEMSRYWVAGAAALAGGVVVVIITAVHDHARIRCVDTTGGAGRSFIWAWGYVLRDRRAVILALSLLGTALAVWALYQALARWMPASSTLGLTLSLAWGQVFMMMRALLRVWAFAAAAALQQAAEDT